MVLKSYAKINLSLRINKRLSNGFHDLQSIYCLIDLHDNITINRIKNVNKDKVKFSGPFSKFVSSSNNSITKSLNLMRKLGLISNYFSIKVHKKIPVYAGLGGGSSNAATIINFLMKNKIKRKKLNKITEQIGSDLKLFHFSQGYLKNLSSVVKMRKKHNLNFLLIYPNIKSSTKKIFTKVKNYSKKGFINQNYLRKKNTFIKTLIKLNNDLQSVVVNKYPLIHKLLRDINNSKGCYFSRVTGSGSVCYGLFINYKCSKAALKNLRKKYPKFWFSIAKTI